MLLADVLADVLAIREQKMKRVQVNIRLPEAIAKSYDYQAKVIDTSKNTMYTMALYDYLVKRGLLYVERKN